LPLGVPHVLVQGTEDDQIPPQLPARWAEMARHQGDTVTVTIIPLADHMDVVDPESKAWGTRKGCGFEDGSWVNGGSGCRHDGFQKITIGC
jgi:hypothetical protein